MLSYLMTHTVPLVLPNWKLAGSCRARQFLAQWSHAFGPVSGPPKHLSEVLHLLLQAGVAELMECQARLWLDQQRSIAPPPTCMHDDACGSCTPHDIHHNLTHALCSSSSTCWKSMRNFCSRRLI